jgi:predicted phosphate transport protein (TIGR00153 family)
MKFGIFPRDEGFFHLLKEQTSKVVEGAEILKELFTAFENVPELAGRLKEKESEGDEITHRIINKLNRTFITPIDREDIYNLAIKLDDILDYLEGVAERVVVFKITKTTESARALAEALLKSIVEVSNAVGKVSDLRDSRDILASCIEINRLENVADACLRNSLGLLFEEEQDPKEVMKWKEIYENLENASDTCEDVANILEGVVLKYA